jgi:hypothetical protein
LCFFALSYDLFNPFRWIQLFINHSFWVLFAVHRAPPPAPAQASGGGGGMFSGIGSTIAQGKSA